MNLGNKETLQRDIEHLKRNIQYIIDKKKSISDAEQLKECDADKKPKLAELRKLTDNLKECVRKEKEDKKKANEIKAVTRTIDKLEFAGARKAKSQEAMEKANRAKESREAARREYDEYLSKSEYYNKLDPQTIPGYLFLHESIINNYGLCPFIRMTFEEGINEADDVSRTGDIEKKRRDWLKRQNDGGELYYKLYNTIINKEDVTMWTDVYNKREKDIDYFIEKNLDDSQLEMWRGCKDIASEYVGCTVRTKRIKEKFKMIVHTLSLLSAETNFALHEYLTLKHAFNFVVNELKCDNQKTKTIDHTIRSILSEQFNQLLEEYKLAKEQLEQTSRYAHNMYMNLQNELYLFITNKTIVGMGGVFNNKPQKAVVQEGKYFKRWTVLTEEEKLERFESFANTYIQKNMVLEKLLDEHDAQNKAAKLYDVIKDAFLEKKLVYKDFKWNIKTGVIDRMMCIKYEPESGDFYVNKKTEKGALDNGHQEEKADNKKALSKKKASIRTIMTKENERLINEEILCYIVAKLQSHPSEYNKSIEKTAKEECIEAIKTKLHLKKVTANDKVILWKKYDDIFGVVIANDASKK